MIIKAGGLEQKGAAGKGEFAVALGVEVVRMKPKGGRTSLSTEGWQDIKQQLGSTLVVHPERWVGFGLPGRELCEGLMEEQSEGTLRG